MPTSVLSELGMTWQDVALTVVTATGIYAAMIVFSRLFGQRQVAATSTYDLAFTFAMGSLVGRVILVRTWLMTAVVGLGSMFVLHSVTGWLHHHVALMHRAIQNPPILLVAHGRILEDNIRTSGTSAVEVFQHVRLSGVGDLADVAAVILERNGQMSVLNEGSSLDEAVLTEIRGREELATHEG